MTISERLLALLKLKGHTQKSIADLLHVQPSTVNTWIKGNMESIPSIYIMPICEFLSITPEELLTGEPQPYVNITEDESKLLNIYRKVDHDTRILIMADAIREYRDCTDAKPL